MTATRPTGEQLRFISSKTGEHILDTYLEAAERGNRTLADMVGDIFDTSGIFNASIFDFRFDPATSELQVNVNSSGWASTGAFLFRARGEYANATDYKVNDLVTVNSDTFISTADFTSSTASPDANFTKIIDGQLVTDWATKTDGIIDSIDYSAKAYAIGGTGVTGTIGSAKDWATKTDGPVETTNFSAKFWATSPDVITVADNITEITTAATDITNINTVASGIADVTAVSIDIADVVTVSGNIGDVSTVASINTDITTLANISGIDTLASNSANVTIAADDIANINSVATNIANINTTAGLSAAITAVNANEANINAVAADAADIGAVAAIAADVTGVNAISGAVSSVNANETNVNTVASNITGVNSFAERYTVAATAPSSPEEGDLWYDTTADSMKVFNGVSFVASAAFASLNLADLADVTGTAVADQIIVHNGTAYTPVDLNIEAVLSRGATATTSPIFPTPTLAGHGATKSYVDLAIAALLGGAPEALDTLNELAAALADDEDFATTVNAALAARLQLSGGTLTGDLDMSGNTLRNVKIEDFDEAVAGNTTTGSAVTIPNDTNAARYTVNNDCTITLPDDTDIAASAMRTVTVILEQDGTGGHTPTFAAASGDTLVWNSSATQPLSNTDPSKTTIYTFTIIKGTNKVLGSLAYYEE